MKSQPIPPARGLHRGQTGYPQHPAPLRRPARPAAISPNGATKRSPRKPQGPDQRTTTTRRSPCKPRQVPQQGWDEVFGQAFDSRAPYTSMDTARVQPKDWLQHHHHIRTCKADSPHGSIALATTGRGIACALETPRLPHISPHFSPNKHVLPLSRLLR